MKGIAQPLLLAFCLLVLPLILFVDLLTPRGVSDWMLYFIPLLGTFWLSRPRIPILIATTCTVLLGIGCVGSPPGITLGVAALNRVVGAFVMWTIAFFIWQRKELEETRERVHHHLSHVLSASPVVLYSLRIEHGQPVPVWISENIVRLAGYSTKEPFSLTWWLARVHPDDVADLGDFSSATAPDHTVHEYRFRHANGSYLWIRNEARILRSSTGQAVEMVGSWADITERKQTQQEQDALFAIATEINRTANFEDMLDRVQQRATEILPCDRMVTYCWDGTRTAYRAISWYGVPDDLVPDTVAFEFHPGEKVVDTLLAGETILINDITDQEWVPNQMLAHFRLTAVALVPLAVHHRRLGALVALSEGGRRFSTHQVTVLEGIAQQVSLAMEAHEVHRMQQQDAAVSAALARVGREVIAALTKPALLERLCQVVTEVLECDYSSTVLWQPEEGAYHVLASYGHRSGLQELIPTLRLSEEATAGLRRRLEDVSVLQVALGEASPEADWYRQFGPTQVMFAPLRRGTELIGFQAAGFYGRAAAFTNVQESVAQGLGQLASLTLEHARTVDALRRADGVKSEFIATMSHELRTPLNITMGFNDLLLDEVFGPLTPEQRATLQRMAKSQRKLLELVNSVLDLSRLESRQLSVSAEEVDVAALISELATEPRDEKPQLRATWQTLPTVPRIHTDRGKLKVVLSNLIDNAMKFTEQGSISVRAEPYQEGVEISVIDTGIGIAPEKLPIIFDLFQQADSSTTRRYGGVGLGLYIARRFLNLLGGSITVESQVGCGSAFKVRLPPKFPPGGSPWGDTSGSESLSGSSTALTAFTWQAGGAPRRPPCPG